jgi:N-sulfoglucosamine sulfohydrolase
VENLAPLPGEERAVRVMTGVLGGLKTETERKEAPTMRLRRSAAVAALLFAAEYAGALDRPSILWITSEDNSPYLGCYGDALARTPHLDRLAAQGVRYRSAFANAPVCSSARSTLITGMYASSLGIHNHRSRVAIPEGFKLYPEHLRAAGYYCSNNSKTDYNVAGAGEPWDESSNKAHYRNRAPGQPFFAVFNLLTSHESRVAPKADTTAFRLELESVKLPPYHPDTPDIRRDWANYYDQMTLLDEQVGKLLAELESEDLSGETIVFYYADHGGALPRGKRNIHDSGTRVPLIIRFPEKWAHLAPAKPGEWVDDLVSFVDLPATVFSLCGVAIPGHYEGRPFLGTRKGPPREHVFLFRGRMDERYDTVRAVRDAEFRYVRNYSPHRPWGQHYSYPFRVLPSMRSWHAEFTAGRCDEAQARYWRPKPPEELYCIAEDPFEMRNRIADPQHAMAVARLRAALRSEILSTRDAGFIPEGMFPRFAEGGTIYEYAHSDAYPLRRVLELADKASDGDPENVPLFAAALDDPHPVLRYWAATGCLILREEAAPARDRLLERLSDDWADVRVVSAEAVAHLGEEEAALKTLAAVLSSGNLHEALAAQNALDFLREAGRVTLDRAQDLVRAMKFAEPADRIPRYLLELP